MPVAMLKDVVTHHHTHHDISKLWAILEAFWYCHISHYALSPIQIQIHALAGSILCVSTCFHRSIWKLRYLLLHYDGTSPESSPPISKVTVFDLQGDNCDHITHPFVCICIWFLFYVPYFFLLHLLPRGDACVDALHIAFLNTSTSKVYR